LLLINLVLISILTFSAASSLEISEIMPDPFGPDDAAKPGGEWVELYNFGNESINLTPYLLYDANDENELYLRITNLLLPTNQSSLCAHCYGLVYRDHDSDFDLSRVEDEVRLSLNGTIVDEVSYAQALEGMSFSKFPEGWFRTFPTPGKENIYSGECDWNLILEMNNSLFSPEDFGFSVFVKRNHGLAENITVRGSIYDLNGQEIKSYSPWTDKVITTSSSKKYSPNLKEGVYQAKFGLANLSCNDSELSNNEVTKLFAINLNYHKNESSLQIEKLYLGSDAQAQWGNQFTAKINIYKGEESKYSVQAWVEQDGLKVSATTKLSLYDNYKNYSLNLPFQLDPQCDFPDSSQETKAQLVVEAFGLHQEEDFTIKGLDKDLCKDWLKLFNQQQKLLAAKDEPQLTYLLLNNTLSLIAGDYFAHDLMITNEATAHNFTVWSYLYRGNKCYSCDTGKKDRETNNQTISLASYELKTLNLLNQADLDLSPGVYNLKVKIQKDQQKTTHDLNQEIVINSPAFPTFLGMVVSNVSSSIEDQENLSSTSPTNNNLSSLTGMVVYESSSVKAKNLLPYILLLACVLTIIILALLKN